MERPSPHPSENAPSFSPQPPQPPRPPENTEERGEIRSTIIPPIPALKRLERSETPSSIPQTSTLDEPATEQEVPSVPHTEHPQATTPSESENASLIHRRSKAVYAGVAAVLILGTGMGTKLFGGSGKQEKTDGNDQNSTPSLMLQDRDKQPEANNQQTAQNRQQPMSADLLEIPAIDVPQVPVSRIERVLQGERGSDEFSQLLEKAQNQKLSEAEITRLRDLRNKATDELKAQLQTNVDSSRDQFKEVVSQRRTQLQHRIDEMRLQLKRSVEDQERALENTVDQHRAELEKRIGEIRRITDEAVLRSR